MDFSKIKLPELIAIVGGALLAVSLFLDWYTTVGHIARINGVRGPQTGWAVHTILRWLLLAAAAAPIILSYIALRGKALSWPRGELTAVLAIVALGLVGYNGVIQQPGTSNTLTSLQYGWFLAMLGILLMFLGSAQRASSTERPRKPPGVL